MSAAKILAGRAFVEMSLKRSKFLSSLRGTENTFIGTMSRMAKSTAFFGAKLLGGGIGGLGSFVLPVQQFAKFERAMDEVFSITGEGGAKFRSLEEKARQLGATTVFSSTEAANAMTVFARANLDSSQILDAMKPTLDAAAVGHLNMAEAAGIVTGVMKGMSIPFSKTTETVDILTQATISANTDLQSMGDAFRFIGPLGQLAGESVQDVAAAVMSLADANITGEMSGTTIRGALLSLQNPSKEAADQLNKLGVQTKDSQGDFVGLINIIGQLEKSFDGLGSSEKVENLGKIFQQRQAAGVAQLINTGASGLQSNSDSLGTKDITASLAEIQLDNVSGDFTRFISVLTNVGIAIGESLEGPVRIAFKLINDKLSQFEEFIKANQYLVTAAAAAASVLVAVGSSLIALGLSLGIASFAIGSLIGALMTLVQGVLIPFVLMGGLRKILFSLAARVLPLFTGSISIAARTMISFGGIAARVGSLFIRAFSGITAAVARFTSIGGRVLLSIFRGMISGVRSITAAFNAFAGAVNFGPVIVGMIRVVHFLTSIPFAATAAIASLANVAALLGAFAIGQQTVQSIMSGIAGLATVIGAPIISAFQSVMSGVAGLANSISGVFGSISNSASSAFGFISDITTSSIQFIGSSFSEAGNFIMSVFSSVGIFAGQVFADIPKWFAFMSDVFTVKLNTIWDAFTTTFKGIFDALASGQLELAGKIAMDGLKTIVIDAMDVIASVFGTTTEGLIDMFAASIREIQLLWLGLQRAFKSGQNVIATVLAETGEFVGLLPEGTSDNLGEDQKREGKVFDRNEQSKIDAILAEEKARKASLKGTIDDFRKAETRLNFNSSQAAIDRARGESRDDIDRPKASTKPFDESKFNFKGIDQQREQSKQSGSSTSTFVGAAAGQLGLLGSPLLKSSERQEEKMNMIQKEQVKTNEKIEKAVERAMKIQEPLDSIQAKINAFNLGVA